jgi:primosomal protein N''
VRRVVLTPKCDSIITFFGQTDECKYEQSNLDGGTGRRLRRTRDEHALIVVSSKKKKTRIIASPGNLCRCNHALIKIIHAFGIGV